MRKLFYCQRRSRNLNYIRWTYKGRKKRKCGKRFSVLRRKIQEITKVTDSFDQKNVAETITLNLNRKRRKRFDSERVMWNERRSPLGYGLELRSLVEQMALLRRVEYWTLLRSETLNVLVIRGAVIIYEGIIEMSRDWEDVPKILYTSGIYRWSTPIIRTDWVIVDSFNCSLWKV